MNQKRFTKMQIDKFTKGAHRLYVVKFTLFFNIALSKTADLESYFDIVFRWLCCSQ